MESWLKMMMKGVLEKNCFEIPPCRKTISFVTEFVTLGKILLFYEKKFPRMKKFENRYF